MTFFAASMHGADAPGAKPRNPGKPVWAFTPDPALPNVLILGDSISIGYTLKVRELLKGKANVFRPVSIDGTQAVNCQGTEFGKQHIESWLAGHRWSVIHFNWGLHDLKHVALPGASKNSNRSFDPVQASVEDYSRNLEFIVGKLKATGARLIFATTTPVAPGTTNPLREVDAPGRYNAAAIEVIKPHGAEVNDLFAFCNPQLEKLQRPRNVHFTPAGNNAMAQQVAEAIQTALESPATKANL